MTAFRDLQNLTPRKSGGYQTWSLCIMPWDMADVSVVEGGQITLGRWTACQVDLRIRPGWIHRNHAEAFVGWGWLGMYWPGFIGQTLTYFNQPVSIQARYHYCLLWKYVVGGFTHFFPFWTHEMMQTWLNPIFLRWVPSTTDRPSAHAISCNSIVGYPLVN